MVGVVEIGNRRSQRLNSRRGTYHIQNSSRYQSNPTRKPSYDHPGSDPRCPRFACEAFTYRTPSHGYSPQHSQADESCPQSRPRPRVRPALDLPTHLDRPESHARMPALSSRRRLWRRAWGRDRRDGGGLKYVRYSMPSTSGEGCRTCMGFAELSVGFGAGF